jgi:hypothetical protein
MRGVSIVSTSWPLAFQLAAYARDEGSSRTAALKAALEILSELT